MRRPVMIAFALVGLASGRALAADDDASPFESKSTAVYAVLGLGTPVGFVGAELEQTTLPTLSISVGVGWGASGPQAAAMTHLLLGSDTSKLAVGVGISGGQYTWTEFCIDCDDPARKRGMVAWGNVEIGGEHRLRSGFAVRYFAGYGRIIAGNLVCDPSPFTNCTTGHQNDGYDLIYTGVALGGSF